MVRAVVVGDALLHGVERRDRRRHRLGDEVVDAFSDAAGRYENYVHVLYTTTDQSQHIFEFMNYVQFGGFADMDSIADLQTVQGCLTGKGEWSMCIQPHWSTYEDAYPNAPPEAILERHHGWFHEYFHHTQWYQTLHKTWLPFWWMEGVAGVIPSAYIQEHFGTFPESPVHARRGDGADDQVGELQVLTRSSSRSRRSTAMR